MRTREPIRSGNPGSLFRNASLAVRQGQRRPPPSGVGVSARLLALVLILLGTTWAPSESSAEVYQALGDFSLVQGFRGWTYLDSTGAVLTPDATHGWWKGVQSYLLLGPGGGTRAAPGTRCGGGRRRRTARRTSRGRRATSDAGGGDGVLVSIRHGATVIWQATINNGNTTGVAFDLTRAMHQGETLDFVINRRANNGYDSTYFNPTIVLTGSEPDTTPPVISSVTAYVTPSSALISWMTDEPSNGQVEYGPTAELGTSSFLVQNFETDHTFLAPITISNLLPGTLYHFRIRSADAAGNVAVSDDFTFTTPAVPPGTAIYQASSDFSLVQGTQGWTYEGSNGTLWSRI